jgi:hypothetical protein
MANFKFRINGLMNGVYGWSMGFQATAVTDVVTAATTLQGAFETWWNTTTDGFKNYIFTDITGTTCQASAHNASWQLISKQVETLTLNAGLGATGSLPYYVSPFHRFFGASDTKSDRGGMHMPATAIGTLTLGKMDAAFLASQQIIWPAFWSNMSALTAFTLVSYNKHTNKQGDPPFTNHNITDTETSDKPGTVRARVRKQRPIYGTAIPVP